MDPTGKDAGSQCSSNGSVYGIVGLVGETIFAGLTLALGIATLPAGVGLGFALVGIAASGYVAGYIGGCIYGILHS